MRTLSAKYVKRNTVSVTQEDKHEKMRLYARTERETEEGQVMRNDRKTEAVSVLRRKGRIV